MTPGLLSRAGLYSLRMPCRQYFVVQVSRICCICRYCQYCMRYAAICL
jgi:hypothetical protein